MNLNLNASKYLNWNEMKTNLSWKVKKCKDKLMQIYWILNKVQKTLNSIIIIIIIIIIINSYTLVTSIKSIHERLYAMYVEWTKFSEIENRSLSIRLLRAVETIKLRLCIKFVRDDCMLENECSCHFKLLQQLHFHHHSRCCFEILRDWDDDSIVHEVNVL